MKYPALALSMLLSSFVISSYATDSKTEAQIESKSERTFTFSELDLNNNGELEESEVLAADDKDYEEGREVEFEELDANDDSKVTPDEWKQYFTQL